MTPSKAAATCEPSPGGANPADKLHLLAARLPRPLRFLSVGGFGLLTDLCLFTVFAAHDMHPLIARLISLAAATLVTWRLNRALTFDNSYRHQGEEAARYTAVTVTAQGVSYAIFALLVLTALAWLPQAALLIGAAFGAAIGYLGHRFFAFAPKLSHVRKAPVR
jgi:putative flippase GtrA